MLISKRSLCSRQYFVDRRCLPADGEQRCRSARQQIDLSIGGKLTPTSLAAKNGWLALVALDWLQEGDSSFGSAPDNKIKLQHVPAHLGVLRMHDGRVTILPSKEGVQAGLLLDWRSRGKRRSVMGPDDSRSPSEIVRRRRSDDADSSWQQLLSAGEGCRVADCTRALSWSELVSAET